MFSVSMPLCLPLLLLVVAAGEALSHTQLPRRGLHRQLGAPPHHNATLPPDQWFTQTLDHSRPTDTRTWQQRYQVVTDYHVSGGPVFLMIGAEGPASAAWLVRGNWVNYAKQYNALMFQLEHRFYGESHPTSDLSTENLSYLTSEQALADVAYFVTGMNKAYSLPEGTKWVAFGGSYAGNLAAWVRARYPHLIHAAMSASGPVLAQADFTEYMEVVRRSLATYGENCTTAVQTANRQVNKLLRSEKGRESLRKLFRLCNPIDPDNQNDRYLLLETMADNLAGIVQYNKDNRAFRSPSWNITIDTVCGIMVNKTLGNAVVRYAAVNSLLMDTYQEECFNCMYESMIESMKNISWKSDAASGSRQWLYQTCTEFGYFQTSETKEGFFGEDFPLKFFTQQCSDVYGEEFTERLLDDGVARSNALYGGLDGKATRVVYVHGSIDPWHALGITSTRLPESPAIYINGTAHCANMYPPSDDDLPALTAARETVASLLGQWLLQD